MTMVREYLRCVDCLSGAVIERGYREKVFPLHCSLCGGKMRYLGQVETVTNKVVEQVMVPACDGRCTHAKGFRCDCEGCLGRNHGTGLVVPITLDKGIRAVTPKIDADQAQKRAAEYRAAIDAVWAALETKLAPQLGGEIRRRWEEGIDRSVCMHELVWRTARQIQDIADYQTHKKRVNALRELAGAIEGGN